MPIYEYQCTKKGHIFEVLQSSSEAGPRKCEVCGASPVQKLVSSSSFQLKGSGWYATDYKTPSKGSDLPANSGKQDPKKNSDISKEIACPKKEITP
jgi:putative FmdB family regulatory protein